MAFSLVGCSEKLTTTEDLIAKAREEKSSPKLAIRRKYVAQSVNK